MSTSIPYRESSPYENPICCAAPNGFRTEKFRKRKGKEKEEGNRKEH
jgi:hypothetical protein